MAEFTVNHKIISESGGRTPGSSRPIGKSTDSAIASGISKVLEKSLKNLANTLSKQLSKDLDKILTSVLRRSGGASTGVDLKGYTKNVIKAVTDDMAKDFVKTISKKYIGAGSSTSNDPSRATNSYLKNIDKHIEAAIGKINASVQTKTGGKVQLDSASIKELSKAMSGPIKDTLSKLVPKETGTTIRELGNVSRTLMSLLKEIKELGTAIKGMKKSGGGVDLSEAPKVVESFKKLGSAVKKLPEEFNKLKESSKKLIGEQKILLEETKNMIDAAKKEAAATIKVIKESPTKFLPSAQPVKKEAIKVIDTAKGGLDKVIQKLGGDIDKVFYKSLDSLDKIFGNIVKKWGNDLAKKADQFAISDSTIKTIDDLSSFLDQFRKAFKDLNLPRLKEVTAKTIATGKPVISNETEKLLKDLTKILVKMSDTPSTPADFKKDFSDSMVDIGKKIESGVKDGIKEGFKESQFRLGRDPSTAEQIKNIQKATSQIRGPFRTSQYPQIAIPPTTKDVTLDMPGTYGKQGTKVREAVQQRISGLASSLKSLQDSMVIILDKEFKEAGKGWEVVKDSTQQNVQDFFKIVTSGNLKTAGKQFAFDVANVSGIKRELTKRGVTTKVISSTAAVKELKSALIDESVQKARGEFLEKIAQWIKTKTKEEISVWEGLGDFKGKLTEVKELDVKSKGVLPGKELVKSLKARLSKQQAEEVFKKTFASVEAERYMKQPGTDTATGARRSPLVRTVSIPAARLTKTGATVFETARGSQRALPQFAVFKTGFEKIYNLLEKQQALVYDKGFAEKIQKVGVRPTGPDLKKANELAKEMLKDFAGTGELASAEIRKHLQKASKIRAVGLAPSAKFDFGKKIESALKIDKLSTNMDGFLKAIEEAGLSAFDIVKAMDQLEFKNIYDILQKVLTTGLEPLQALGKSPQFDKTIRDLETAIQQTVQTLPLIEPGRPRRALHQENVLNLLSRTSGPFVGEKPLAPEKQTEFIKDLNIRFNEMIRDAGATGEQILKKGMRTISTLGIPEEQASKVQFFRPGTTAPSEKFLSALDAVSTKMYTDILPEMAPFGSQFTQFGRNIANVTNALTSSKSEIDKFTKGFGATPVGGFGTEFPSLRTQRESSLISGGRLGSTGYGFNVMTELRHTAGTFEDQILVSGKMAEALTSIVKNIVKPSAGGRLLRGDPAGAESIEAIREGVVSDTAINKVFQEFQKVLGVPQKYQGQADRAFLDEVKKSITVVRGEEVEVQQARLTEVFLNFFGRKLTTRYGSKGVSVTPQGLDKSTAADIVKAIQAFPKAKVKVLTEEERGKAGLGVALLPKSMGELLSEVIGKYGDHLTKSGFKVEELQDSLLQSGNKFILDLFKTTGVVTAEEAFEQSKIYENVVSALDALGLNIKNDLEGIKSIRGLYKAEVGEKAPLFKEKPIDVRISSYGIGKRGLQPEFLESIMSNIAGTGPRGVTTLATKLPTKGKFGYPELLGTAGQKGLLSTISGELGFETIGKREDIEQMLFERFKASGKDPDVAKVMAKRGAALEALSNYYTTIIDETGKVQKSIVGEKFVSIVEEPGQFAPTTASDIRRKESGVKIDVPVFAAYSTVFGESSKMMEEIGKGSTFAAKKHWEFIKALQFTNDQAKDLQSRLSDYLEEVDLLAVKSFDQATGTLAEQGDKLDPENLAKSLIGTIFDVKKFPKPFLLQIPKATGKVGEKEPFYVPSPIARGTFAEELIAGERGFDVLARRIQHVINMAKQADELLQRPAELQSEIEMLETEMNNLVMTGKSAQAQDVGIIKESKQTDLDRILSGSGAFSTTIKARVLDKITELGKKARQSTNVDEVKEILDTLMSGLSTFEAPAEAFRVKGEMPLGVSRTTSMSSEVENINKFLERSKADPKKSQLQAYKLTVDKARDLLIGQSPQMQTFFDKVVKGISEIKTGQTPETSDLLKELQGSLSSEKRFMGKPLLQSLEEKKRLTEPVITATRSRQTAVDRAIQKGEGAGVAAKLGIDIEQDLQAQYFKKLDNLQKAKIDYYNELARATVGKEGAVVSTLFSKTIPGLMQKAITATVDRTKELNEFKNNLRKIFEATDPSLIDLGNLESITQDINKIASEHAKRVTQQKRAGLPVLKQHEVGIPMRAAKKLPVEFTKKFTMIPPSETGEEGRIERFAEPVKKKGTLFDLLSYIEDLQEATETGRFEGKPIDIGELGKKIQDHIEKDLFPYVEAIRYPFTGVSSIVPYEAKLLTGRLGREGEKTFAVPGAPDMDVVGFNKIINDLRSVIEKAGEMRESEFKRADITGTAADMAKIAEFGTLIDQLSQVISEVIPKYAAHTAKLDFDGDQIVIHTAKTKEAREEIKRHHDTIVNFNSQLEKGVPFGKTTQGMYRDIFTSEALLSQQPTGPAILAESAEAFYKKFPKEKGFEFLKKPFLTEEMEFLKPGEKLSTLALGGQSITNMLEDVVGETIKGSEYVSEAGVGKLNKDLVLDAIKSVQSPFESIEKEIEDISTGDFGKRIQFADDILEAIRKLDAELGSKFTEEIEKIITNKLFEERYKDAITAQLFKIQTGIEVESLYRINRIAESDIGFGGGFIGKGKFKSSEQFRQKHPADLGIIGKQPELESQTLINEIVRFGIQKGMDVKHAGERPVAGEMVKLLTRGPKGAADLWKKITDDTKFDKSYDELSEFQKVNEKAIKLRTGALPTEQIRTELKSLYKARGTKFDAGELAGADREQLQQAVVDAVGLKNFLEELALQIKTAAIEGTIKELKKTPPAKRPKGAGDIEAYARKTVGAEMATEGINVRKRIAMTSLPLYSFRRGDDLKEQLKLSEKMRGELPTPGFEFRTKKPDEVKALMNSFREARATAMNLQDELQEVIKGSSGEAAAQMMRGSIELMHSEQAEIEGIVKKLKQERFDAAGINRNIRNLKERLLTGTDIPKITADILKTSSKARLPEMERLAEFAGLPTMGKEEKFKIGVELSSEFRTEGLKRGKAGGLEADALEEAAQKFANGMVEKAEVLFEMDRILDALVTKAQEGRFLVSLLPKKAAAQQIKSQVPPTKSFNFEKRMKEMGLSREPGAGDISNIPPRLGGPGGGFGELYKGGIVPVHIVSVAKDLAIGFGGSGPTAKEDEIIKSGREAKAKVEEFKRTIASRRKEDDVDYSKVYRASGLAAGGEYSQRSASFGKAAKPGTRGVSQVESIMKSMLALDEYDERLEASADVGTALHLKIQEALKQKYGAGVDIEKFVNFSDDVSKSISGHIDAVIRDASGKAKDVIDIKTVGQHFVDSLDRLADASGVVDFESTKESGKMAVNVRQKLENVASQLNLYVAALKQMGEASEDISAEAQFFSVDDKLLEKPIKVKFKYDPDRLSNDLNAITTARELINEFVLSNKPLEEAAEEYRAVIQRVKQASSKKGVSGFATAKSPEALLKGSLEPALEFTSEQIDSFVEASLKVYKATYAQPGMAREPGQPKNIDPAAYKASSRKFKITPDERVIPKYREDFAEPLQAQLANLRELHKQTVAFQQQYNELGLNTVLGDMHKDIQGALSERTPPLSGAKFNEVISALKESEDISYADFIKAWKLWRIAMGDFLSNQAKQAEDAFTVAKEGGSATQEFAEFSSSVEKFRESIIRSAGKQTDIYTQNRRFIFDKLAKEGGVFLNPEQLVEKSRGIFGEDDQTRDIFKNIVESLESGGPLAAPTDVVRGMVKELSGVDQELLKMMENAELVKRMGSEMVQTWDFDRITKGAVRLREALAQYSKFNLSEAIDVEARTNIKNIIGMLAQVEKLYGKLDMAKTTEGPFGKYEAGLIKIPQFLPPSEQEALHLGNIQRVRERFAKPEEAGGAEIGEKFTYFMKVADQAGNSIKNIGIQFNKYGEAANVAGEKVGKFSEINVDLGNTLRTTSSMFKSALKRVVMWGGAATLVYGGVQQLKDSIGELADIEMGIAQLKMVMNPLETDFDKLSKSATGFAKQYGVGVTDVIKSMKIFAQQGLKQSEVVDRAQVSTLAANVTTLAAAEATEALTAAMKSFGPEIGTAMTALDSWSEVEAKHAITAGDMANAIKKSAAAARNAGFTFNELNGVVASIGAVTRQSGKEVGTAMRFIFRRLTAEKGPKVLAGIGIPTITDSGELRRGFDVLSDLNAQWNDLTSAQKMNIAQAIGGTRQYNAVLVLMDNWNEALSAIEHSTNSKGSAERRNLEVMKTYAKQLEQTKAAATELKMEFGKFVFPAFKVGLTGLKTVFEIMTAIPAPIKVAGAALTMFFAYAAKGVGVFDSLTSVLDRGQSAISNFYDEFKKQGDISLFEVLGRKQPSLDVRGLKTMAPGVEGATKGTVFKDFHSGIGKLAFLLKNVGDSYNEFLGGLAVKTTSAAGTAGEAIENLSGKLSKLDAAFALGSTGIAAVFPGIIDDIVVGLVNVSTTGTKGLGEVLRFIESKFGPRAEKFAADAAAHNTGLVKSLLPLGLTAIAVAKSFDSLYGSYVRMGKSAQDYAKYVYNIKRVQETELQGVRDLMSSYKMLEQRLEDVNKVIQKPELKEKRQSYDTYVDPLLSLSKLQNDAIGTTNRLAEANLALVSGYDKFGNAVLKTSVNLQTYLKTLEKSKLIGIAKTDIDVASKFIEDLTTTEGPEKWKYELKSLLKEAPLVGDLLSKGIKVAPAKALDVITGKINNLIALRNKYPLTSAFDEDIKEYQSSLKSIRSSFNETYSDFRKTLSSISTTGLDAKTITDLFTTPGLQKGYELMIEVEPEIKLANIQRTKANIRKITSEDVLGAEILKRVKPGISSYFDVSAELTKARLETAGIAARDTGKVMSGDIVTLIPQIADQFHVAGNQAIVQLKETTDGVYEWVATYFNTKTMQIEERPFDENIQKMVDRIFPVRRIQEDLAERIDALNAFVAGASAGLRGVGKADFKKDFSLGERFFADIPTTTLLQGSKGFTPDKGFGKSPFQQDWAKTIEDFFFKPMREYKGKLAQLSKLQLTGLEESEKAGDITLSKDLYEELIRLQDVLKNNQVVLQYRAVFVDLTKTIEAGTRSIKENIAVEKSRQALDKPVTGFMKNIARGLDNLETGARSFADLTVKQLALIESPKYRRTAGRLSEVNIRREGQMENIFAADKVKTTLDSIRDVAKGFGASLTPEEMKQYVETVARTGDMATAELKIETAKVVGNTAMTVQKLDDILANMGDPDAIGGQLGGIIQDISAGTFDDSTMKTIGAMNKAARIRDRALKDDDSKLLATSNTVLDKLVQKLVDNIGFGPAVKQIEGRELSPLLRQPLSSTEFKQRAFAGLDSKVFVDKMTKYGDASNLSFGKKLSQFMTSGVLRRVLTGSVGVKQTPAFRESEELEQLRKLQEDANKKSFVDSKSLVKAATAFTVFEQFNKKHSSKVLTSLESQATELDEQISATKTGSAAADTSKLEEGLESVKKAIEKEKESLEFHKMAQAVTMISGGALQFGRAVGLSEDAVKKLGAGAIATYGAWKLVTQVTGKEMPEAAKEFGSVLKEAASEYKEKGKVGIPLGLKVKSSGKKFEEAYGERVKGFTGVTKEEFKKKVESKLGEKSISEASIQKEAEKIRQIAKGSESINRLQQLVLATLAATFAGYANEKLQPGVRSATLEKNAEEQAKVLEDIMKTYPNAVEDIIKEMRQETKAFDTKPMKLDTTEKSLVLDTDEEYNKVLQDTSKFRDGLVSEYQEIAKETKKLQDSLNEIELTKGLEKQINDINRGFLDRIQRFQISRTYGGPATLNKPLMGFPGEVELPMGVTDMSTQQRAFTDFSKKFKDSIAVYSFSLQEMSGLQDDYGNLLAQRRQFIEDEIDDTDAWDKLEDQIESTNDTLENMVDALRRVGEPLNNLFKFTDAIYNLKDALAEVAIIDATESIRGFKEFQKSLDKLLGGPSPEAVTQISPKFEREAAGVGIRLTDLQSTKKGAEEARILIAMTKASGEELRLLTQELIDLPEKFRREEQGRKQSTEDQKLIRQLGPYEQALNDIERLVQSSGISDDRRQELRDLQEQIVAVLNRATEKVPGKQLLSEVGGGFWNKLFGTYREDEKRVEEAMAGRDPDALIRRGVGAKEAAKLDEQVKSMTEQLLKKVPTVDMIGMKLSVTDPLLRELEKHTILLVGIAKGSGVDVKDIGVDLRSRYAREYEEVTKQPGLLDKIGTVTSPIRMINKLMDSVSKITDGKIPSGDEIFRKINDVTSPIRIINKLMTNLSKLIGFGEKRAFGGPTNGRVFGAGGPKEDKVHIMASPGEFMINAASSKKLGYNTLNYLNKKGELPGFAEGGMVSNWLKTAWDFYFGKKDVEMTGPQETMGRMSYLSNKETKKKRLDEAFDINAKGFAEGGLPVGAGRPISTITGKFVPTDEEKWIGGKKFLSALLDVIPGVGDVKSGKEAWSGEDILTGEKLGILGRSLAGLAVLPFVPGSIKNLSKTFKKTKNVGTSFMIESAGLLSKEIRFFKEMYPDVAKKLERTVNILPQHKMSARGKFVTKESEAGRLGLDEPYSVSIAERLLTDSSKYKPTTATHTFKHEKWHAMRQFVKDKIRDSRYLGESEETLDRFLEMNRFMDSFGKRKPFSNYAERVRQAPATDKYFMSLKKAGHPEYREFVPPKRGNYASENFSEFAKKVEIGEIKGGLAQQFQSLFDPKYFQLGEPRGFAEGGPVKYVAQGDKIYGLNAAGEIIKEIGDNNKEKERFLRNKAYAVGIGETDPSNVLFKDLPRAKFGVTTRQQTGRRFASELSKDLASRFPLGSFSTDVLVEQLAKDKQSAKRDPKMREILRFPGLKEAPKGFNMTFDRETGAVSGEGLNFGVQSYYDLKEFQFKDMKRAMKEGKLSLPSLAPGFVSTAGEDPTTKDIFKRKKIQEDALRKRLLQPSRTDLRGKTDFTPNSEQILQVFGRDTQLLYDLHSKLKYIDENTPGGLGSKEQRKESDLYNKYAKVTSLLEKGPLDDKDLSFVSQLMRDRKLIAKHALLRRDTEREQFGLDMSPRMAYMINPKMFGEYNKARESGDKSVEKASKLFFKNKLGQGKNLKNIFESAKNSTEEQKKLELFLKEFAPKFSTDELRKINEQVKIQEIIKQLKKKDPKSAGATAHEYSREATRGFQSMPVMHAGGQVRKTGPVFAQRGELVLPKGFAEGGFIDDTTSSAVLKEGAIKIQDDGIAETIAEKIKTTLESTKIDIKEDAKVGVDVSDVTVPVDVGDVKIGIDTVGVTVPVDTSDVSVGIDVTAAADTIGQAISNAINNASVDVKTTSSTDSVGADKIDEVASLVSEVQDKVFTLRDELESEIDALKGSSVNSGTLRAEVESIVGAVMGRIEQDVNNQGNTINNLTSKVIRTEQRLDVKIDAANGRALDAQNFATR